VTRHHHARARGPRIAAVNTDQPVRDSINQRARPQLQQAFLSGDRDTHAAQHARPYVSPMSWALYTAYNSIVLQAALQFNALKSGDDPTKFVNAARTLEVVKTVLPEFAPLLEERREGAYPELLPEIEERLLAELRATAEGREWDQQSVERAKKVAQLAAIKDPAT